MSASSVLKTMKDKEIEYVDLRFTDPRGKLQHVTMDAKVVDDSMLNDGVFFDGSSIAGWKAINESDMILKPDLSRTVVDPFTSHNTLNIFCDILDAIKKGNPNANTLARNQFYGHLYLGLYFESQNEENKAAEYIALAAKGHESHGYMGQVARVHHEWLQKKSKQKEAKKQ